MHILDPGKLDDGATNAIKQAFKPLLARDIMDVADELEQDDRKNFDDVVIASFGLKIDRERVYESLLALVEIRQTATD